MSEGTEKIVTYLCPGCELEIVRRATVATKKRKSFCAYAGKDVQMRRLRWKRVSK